MLNSEKMQKELERFEQHKKYQLIGGNKVFNANNAASCSSLAYSLLVAGGIRKLVQPTFSIRDYLLVTPNNLAKLVLLAKSKESELLKQQNDQADVSRNVSGNFK